MITQTPNFSVSGPGEAVSISKCEVRISYRVRQAHIWIGTCQNQTTFPRSSAAKFPTSFLPSQASSLVVSQ